jgi:hypothetical protein
MQILTGLIIALCVLLVIVGSIGAWYEWRAESERQKRVGQFYADAGGIGIGIGFLLAAVAIFYIYCTGGQ